MVSTISYAESQVKALAEGLVQALRDVFGQSAVLADEVVELQRLQTDKNFFIRIPFYGAVIGEYLIALDEDCAVRIAEAAGMPLATGLEPRRRELVDIFGEALNVSVGPAVALMGEALQHTTFATPRAGFGSIYYPGIPNARALIETGQGDLECHFHIDRMKIASAAPVNQYEALNHELQRALNQTRAILDGLEQGVLVVSLQGIVAMPCSERARELLSARTLHDQKISELFGLSSEDSAQLAQWFELIREPCFHRQWTMCQKLNPIRDIEIGPANERRVLRVNWRPIFVGDQLDRVLAVVKDLTEDSQSRDEIARLEQSNRRVTERVIALIGSDPRTLSEFLQGIHSALNSAREVVDPTLLPDRGESLYVAFHTIKGTAGSLGFDCLAQAASVIEDEFAHPLGLRVVSQHPELGTAKHRGDVVLAMALELAAIDELFATVYTEGSDRLSVDRRGYDALLEDLADGQVSDLDLIRVRVNSLNSLEFAVFCRRFDRLVQSYRAGSGKAIDDLLIIGGDLLVHSSVLRIMDPCITHVVRNAIDHGFEFDRDVLGKGPGQLLIAFAPVPSGIEITIEDDGGGIRPDVIAERAIRLGLVTRQEIGSWEEEEILELIYTTGFSSAATVTEVSGRGAGMGAVRETLRAHGGTIHVTSKPGVGTCVRLFLPSQEQAGWSVPAQRATGARTASGVVQKFSP